jgi:hypothetical protein
VNESVEVETLDGEADERKKEMVKKVTAGNHESEESEEEINSTPRSDDY